jgi:hypothetical protein
MRPRTVHEYRNAVLSAEGPRTALAKLVAVTVAQLMDGETLESFHGAETIARCAGLSERAVRTYLGALVRDGWLTERTKRRGRDFWLKVRTAAIPEGHPAHGAGSNGAGLPARGAGSKERDASPLPARGAGLPAADDTTPCISPHGDPARRAGDLDQKSCTDLGAASPSPAAAGSAALSREVIATIRSLHGMKYPPERIAEFENIRRSGATLEDVRSVVNGAAQ